MNDYFERLLVDNNKLRDCVVRCYSGFGRVLLCAVVLSFIVLFAVMVYVAFR